LPSIAYFPVWSAEGPESGFLGGAWGYKRNPGPINRVVHPDETLAIRARFGP